MSPVNFLRSEHQNRFIEFGAHNDRGEPEVWTEAGTLDPRLEDGEEEDNLSAERDPQSASGSESNPHLRSAMRHRPVHRRNETARKPKCELETESRVPGQGVI